jgi:chromosome segregation ATPase
MTNHYTDVCEATIKSLRQQLADRDEQISDLTISSDTYFAERNSARDVWRRASKDRDELRQQLTESENLRAGIEMGMDCANAEVVRLREQVAERNAELKRINHALNDVRVDLTITASEAITELRQQLAAAHELIRLIFESTPPYREDDTCVFSDAVIKKWKELLP